MDRGHCTVCGSNAIPGTRFCSSCGKSLPEPAFKAEDQDKKLPLDGMRKAWLIGSAPVCGIVVSEATVSGRHCRLLKAGDEYSIEDLGSANGTWVSGQRIHSRVRVQPHQLVTLGHGVSFPWDRVLGTGGEVEAHEPPSPETTVIRVGRRPDNDVVLNYVTVSGYHAQIVISEAGVLIEDLGSMNGTALNSVGNRIRRAPLNFSDVVFFGTRCVPASQLLTPDPAASPASAPGAELPFEPGDESYDELVDPAVETAQWKPESASVLFTDIVGFTLLDPSRQVQARQKLEQAVQDADVFKRARRENTILARPTGDGVALVFFAHPCVAAECAVQIAKMLENNKALPLRMGIHQGTVYRMKDINGSEDVSGSGIHMAQRVMDCGEAGHILVSAAVAEALKGTMDWHHFVHAAGTRTIKHGGSMEIYNLRGPDFGRDVDPPHQK